MMTDKRLAEKRCKYWHAGFGALTRGRVLRRFRKVLVGAQLQLSP
jgi:hypothetical protein